MFLKKHKKGLFITWANFDFDSETTNSLMYFTWKFESDSVFSDEYMTDEELVATYKILYTKWEEDWIIVQN